MSACLAAPVLSLDAEQVHQIDPRNVQNLFAMWTVFSRCGPFVESSRRLENMSWRVWARETLCCPPQPDRAIVPTIGAPLALSSGVPSLSNSVASEDSTGDRQSPPSLKKTRSRTQEELIVIAESDDSALSKSRGKEAHLTPMTLEKIVVTIKEKTEIEPLSSSIEASVPAIAAVQSPTEAGSAEARSPDEKHVQSSTESSCMSTLTAETTSTARQSEHRDSDTSVSSDGLIRSGSVVHGFSPITSSFRSRTRLSKALPANAAAQNLQRNLAPLKPGMFQLGGSSEDEENSFEHRMSFKLKPAPRTSSLSQSLGKGLVQKKASFKDIVEQRRIQEGSENDEGAIESSDEDDDDDIMDSAIEEEDDEGEWEDSNSEEGRLAVPDPSIFRRVESRPGLVSRPSMLAAGLAQADRAQGLLAAATRSSPALRRSRPSSPTGPSMPGTPDAQDDEHGLTMQGPRSARPVPIILTTSNTHATAHSPRTTRRNMLSTELTESLRKNLLWERQQKNTTVNAFLKRQTHSMANLQKPAGAVPVSKSGPLPAKDTSKNNSWNNVFDNPWEYHTKGW